MIQKKAMYCYSYGIFLKINNIIWLNTFAQELKIIFGSWLPKSCRNFFFFFILCVIQCLPFFLGITDNPYNYSGYAKKIEWQRIPIQRITIKRVAILRVAIQMVAIRSIMHTIKKLWPNDHFSPSPFSLSRLFGGNILSYWRHDCYQLYIK